MQETGEKSPPAPTAGGWPTAPKALGEGVVREAQRERILRATTELVAKRGFHDTSAERICKESGVSPATFRKHFADKEEAFLAAVDAALEQGRERVARVSAEGGPGWAARVGAGLAELLAMIREDPPTARICLVESMTAGPAGVGRYEDGVGAAIPGLRAGREAAAAGTVLPPLLEETIAGGVAWSIHQKVAVGEAAEIEGLFAVLLQTMLTPYLGAEEAHAQAVRQSAGK